MLIETTIDHPFEYSYEILDYPEIIHHANHVLYPTGTLSFDQKTNYCYLKIANEFIYDCFDFLKKRIPQTNIELPDYFNEEKNYIGAHVSLVYHQENDSGLVKQYLASNSYLNKVTFSVDDLIMVNAFDKTFFALLVTCSQIDDIRSKFNLPKKLNYHGLLVPFHITIATYPLNIR